MRTLRAFTLVELLVILVIIAIIVTIALPNLLGSRIEANETAALATMRQVVQSQLQFVGRKEADLNRNGTGEFGTFGEMSGNLAVRSSSGGTKYLAPTVINPSFRAISPIGEMFRNGYYYRIYLPNAAGTGVLELPGGGASTDVDANLAETTWCAYAWPQKYGVTGRKTYFVNQHGDITFTDDPDYVGAGAAITAGAALQAGGPGARIVGDAAINTVGRDGNNWRIAAK